MSNTHSNQDPTAAEPEVLGGDAGDTGSNAEKPADQWVTGDEPMTGPQASYLETLAQQAGVDPPTGLNKSEASRAIDELQGKAGRSSG